MTSRISLATRRVVSNESLSRRRDLQQPNFYKTNRQRGMQYVLDRYTELAAVAAGSTKLDRALLFVFGDFNFRLNASTFVKVS